MANIYETINAVMNDVTALGKNQNNKHQNFSFRGIDDVMNICGPAFRKHGLNVRPVSVTSTTGQKQTKNSMAKTVDLIAIYEWANTDGDSCITQVAAESFDSGDKATAKAMSVALRTCILQTLCLPTDEPDPDIFTYELVTNDQRKDFLERMHEITDIGQLRNMQAQAKRFNAIKEWTEYGKKLAQAGGETGGDA